MSNDFLLNKKIQESNDKEIKIERVRKLVLTMQEMVDTKKLQDLAGAKMKKEMRKAEVDPPQHLTLTPSPITPYTPPYIHPTMEVISPISPSKKSSLFSSFMKKVAAPFKKKTGDIYALPPAAIYYAFKRYMVSGLTAGAVKS